MSPLRLMLIVQLLCATTTDAQTPTWTASRDLRIGSLDDPDYALTDASGILGFPDGSLCSLHPGEPLVRCFDSAGKLSKVIGRRGTGPGEFTMPLRLGAVHDTLWVYDAGRNRFILFTRDGRLIREVLATGGGFAHATEHYMLGGGSFFVLQLQGTEEERFAGRSAHALGLKVADDGAVQDTLTRVSASGSFVQVTGSGWASNSPNPFADHALVAIAADGKAVLVVERPVAANDREGFFTVAAIGIDGRTTFTQRFRYVPQPITRSQSDPVVEDIAFGVRYGSKGRLTDAAARKAVLDVYRIPAHHPPVTRLVAGWDGTIWLRRENLGTTMTSWTALDAAGRIIGSIHIPRGVNLLAASRQAFIAQENSDGIPYIAWYRIVVNASKPSSRSPD